MLAVCARLSGLEGKLKARGKWVLVKMLIVSADSNSPQWSGKWWKSDLWETWCSLMYAWHASPSFTNAWPPPYAWLSRFICQRHVCLCCTCMHDHFERPIAGFRRPFSIPLAWQGLTVVGFLAPGLVKRWSQNAEIAKLFQAFFFLNWWSVKFDLPLCCLQPSYATRKPSLFTCLPSRRG